MSSALIQDLVVSAIALIAAIFVGRRVARFVRPKAANEPACDNCASGHPCEPVAGSPAAPPATPIPVDLLRSKRT